MSLAADPADPVDALRAERRRLFVRLVALKPHEDPGEAVRAALTRVEGLVAAAEGRAPRPIPDHGREVLADQVGVLAADAEGAGVAGAAAELLAQLRRAL